MFTEQDRAQFRSYYRQSGGRLLQHLRENVPPLLGTTIEAVALEAKHKEGCERIIQVLEDMLSEKPQADEGASGNFTSM
jgi:hypothetical protein